MSQHANYLVVNRSKMERQFICRDRHASLAADEYNLFASLDLFRFFSERFERHHTLVHADCSDDRNAASTY
ncbi:hypothetical protein D3C71_2227000 [compost metagenome]